MRTRIVAIVVLAVLAACSGGGGTYTLAAAGPWQTSHGRNTRLGIMLALREINDNGGVGGHKLAIKDVDDLGNGQKAAQVAQQFVDDRSISAVIGHVTSGAMVAAAKVYDGHLPAVATSASSPDLTGISHWAFRAISSDSANGVEMARFALRSGHKRAAILYENDNYGRGLADAFRRSFTGEIVSIDPIAADAKNADVFIAYFKQKKPDIVFVAGFSVSGLALLTEAKRQGFKTDWMGGDGWTPLTDYPSVSEGVYVGAPFAPTDPRPAAQKFVIAYKLANKGAEPDGNAALGYDATKLLAAALLAVGPDRTRIRDWLSNLEHDHDGAAGPFRFLPSGDPTGKTIKITIVKKDGSLEVVGAER